MYQQSLSIDLQSLEVSPSNLEAARKANRQTQNFIIIIIKIINVLGSAIYTGYDMKIISNNRNVQINVRKKIQIVIIRNKIIIMPFLFKHVIISQ